MIEIAPHIHYIPGKNLSRFPYCTCLYVQGRSHRILIDAGMGSKGMAQVLAAGVDTIILTHSHIDHHLSRRLATDTPVWCHLDEMPFFESTQAYFESTGIAASGVDLSFLPASRDDIFDFEISRTLTDGEEIDLGGITLITLHTPGHSPGHISFFIPEHKILFAADVDLTDFGPFYGHSMADVDDFSASIDRLAGLDYRMVVTGHAGPFDRAVAVERFKAYKAMIREREGRILDFLDRPRKLEDFRESRLIYPRYPEGPELTQWFELVHIKKHLERLEKNGVVARKDGLWFRR